MKIQLLSDHADLIPQLVTWYTAEWEPYYGDIGPGDARADLEERCNRSTLPIGLVVIKNGQPVATAALGLDVSTNLTPSIIGLLVARDQRGKGVASALIDACTNLATELGHPRIYLSTSKLTVLLERLGWRRMGELTFLNDEPGSVYTLDL